MTAPIARLLVAGAVLGILLGLAAFWHDLVVVPGATWLGSLACFLVAAAAFVLLIVLDFLRRVQRRARLDREHRAGSDWRDA